MLTGGGWRDYDLVHVAGLTLRWKATEESVALSTVNAVTVAWCAGYGSLGCPLIGSGHGGRSCQRSRELIEAAPAPRADPAPMMWW